MTKFLNALAVAASLFLCACTTTSTVRLSADRSIITTRGNAFTSPEMVVRDMLVQAATQAQAGGFEWFTVEGAKDVSQSGVAVLPAAEARRAAATPMAGRRPVLIPGRPTFRT